MSGSDAPGQRVEAVLLVSEGITEAQFPALVYCQCREGFHTLPRRHLQTINMSHVESDVEHEGEEESCSQGELLNPVDVEILSDNPLQRPTVSSYFKRSTALEDFLEMYITLFPEKYSQRRQISDRR